MIFLPRTLTVRFCATYVLPRRCSGISRPLRVSEGRRLNPMPDHTKVSNKNGSNGFHSFDAQECGVRINGPVVLVTYRGDAVI